MISAHKYGLFIIYIIYTNIDFLKGMRLQALEFYVIIYTSSLPIWPILVFVTHDNQQITTYYPTLRVQTAHRRPLGGAKDTCHTVATQLLT